MKFIGNLKKHKKKLVINKERAVHIAMNHNNVSLEIAEKYPLTKLREILKQLKIKATIKIK